MHSADDIDRAMAYEAAEREQFEAWAKAETPLKLDRDIASYLSGTTQLAWTAWIKRALRADAARRVPARLDLFGDGIQRPTGASRSTDGHQ